MTKRKTAIALVLFSVLLPLTLLLLPTNILRRDENSEIEAAWILPVPMEAQIKRPQLALTGKEKGLISTAFNRLVRVNKFLQIEPDLLSKWTYSISEKKFIFYLRNGIRFHDGKVLSADDVMFSLHEWAKASSLDHDLLLPIVGVREYAAGLRNKILGVKKVSDLAVEITLSHWLENFITIFANPRFVVFPQKYSGLPEDDYFQKPIGTGPYRVISQRPEVTVLEAYEAYHEGKPRTQQIRIIRMSLAEAWQGLASSSINNLLMYDVTDLKPISASEFIVTKQSENRTFVLIISENSVHTRDPEVRKILASLISKRELISKCYSNSIIASTIIPPGLVGSGPGKGAVSQARPALAAARGLGGFELVIPDYTKHECLSAFFKDALLNTKIKVKVSSFDNMYQRLLDRTLVAWVEDLEFKSEDPLSTINYFNKNSKEYFLGVPIMELQALFQSVNLSASVGFRADTYRKIDEYLTQNYYALPIFYFVNFAVHSRRLKNAEFLLSSKYIQGWHEIYVEKK